MSKLEGLMDKENKLWLKKIEEMSWLKKFSLMFAFIFISVFGLIIYFLAFKPQKDHAEFEIFKSLLQIITVLILGQVVSLIIAQFNYERQKADTETALERQKTEAKIEFQKDVLRRLIRNYTAIKKHRRLLRAKALTPPYDGEFKDETLVKFDAYDEQMQLINDVELEFENIWQELEFSTDLFSNSKSLATHIETMKDYLRNLLHLYEQKRGTFDEVKKTLPLSDLKYAIKETKPPENFEFRDFVGDTKGSIFKRQFITPYRDASKAIRGDILK